MNILYNELTERLEKERFHFDLALEFAETGALLNDATAPWPEDRRREAVVRLTFNGTASEEELVDKITNHGPND